jgi:pimeloyl-ACP methyl ester carboxylesterase
MPPWILVGQSYGGLVIRGFARAYPREVAGVVLVDAVHEDQRTVYGGQAHRIRESARGRSFPAPRIALDTVTITRFRDSAPFPVEPLEAPLDRLSPAMQETWKWAASLPAGSAAQQAEMDWSPEELARFHADRLRGRATLGALPLIVLARTEGGYPSGMDVSPGELEAERRKLQADLAALSSRGQLRFARHAGHNLHLEDPDLVVDAIREVGQMIRSP